MKPLTSEQYRAEYAKEWSDAHGGDELCQAGSACPLVHTLHGHPPATKPVVTPLANLETIHEKWLASPEVRDALRAALELAYAAGTRDRFLFDPAQKTTDLLKALGKLHA